MVDNQTTSAGSEDIREPRVYELGYLLVPEIKEEDLDAAIDAVRKHITDQGGLPIAEGRAELIELAYPMQAVIKNERNEYTKAYFGWIKFDVSPERVEDIKELVDDNTQIIRHLMVSTVRENTMLGNMVANKIGASKEASSDAVTSDVPKKKAKPEPKEPINEAELDKQIDDLVVEE